MSDKELLELAAKAAGYGEPWTLPEYDALYIGPKYKPGHPIEYKSWNPLTDDGDALRLAVKLRIHVSVFADAIGIGIPVLGYMETKWTEDPYAATRRAIVSAAAEIGKEMK